MFRCQLHLFGEKERQLAESQAEEKCEIRCVLANLEVANLFPGAFGGVVRRHHRGDSIALFSGWRHGEALRRCFWPQLLEDN